MEKLINNDKTKIYNNYDIEKINNLIHPYSIKVSLPNVVLGLTVVYCDNYWKIESYKKDCKVKNFLFPGDIIEKLVVNKKSYDLSKISMNKLLNIFYKNVNKKRHLIILRPFSNIKSDLI